ncbi:TetR/AcrR family transcriptional regulator [Denitrobacterium detoxificans]|uniref:Transcriptional regulator, TetR family n=1 Tax=Denitrobacterium detoxificans TaxID=79604 RepID=A0A1H8P955_9ACTN|nr:TetR/AcrR family transcriptional regulator [Denitrobacterium detoxificans]SEO38073.1 transcriptional regulator, TetR family [Denitrobacterium detoxificans]
MTARLDPRSLRTRAAIRRAFEDLMVEKNADRIKVKELTDRAGINRKTFYLHYETIESLFDEVVTELMDEFFEHYETTPDKPKDIDGHARRFFLFLVSQGDRAERLVCHAGSYDFGGRVYAEQMNRYRRLGKDPFGWLPEPEEELVLNFIRTTALDFYRQWVRGGRLVPQERAAQLLAHLTCQGVDDLME